MSTFALQGFRAAPHVGAVRVATPLGRELRAALARHAPRRAARRRRPVSALSATGLCSRCRADVADLHATFERWLSGRASPDELGRVEQALSEDFVLVSPDGTTRDRAEVLDWLRDARGSASPRLRIRCDAVSTRLVSPTCCLVTYREWHREGSNVSVRQSTALLCECPRGPQGVEWMHVHETWLDAGSEEAADAESTAEGGETAEASRDEPRGA